MPCARYLEAFYSKNSKTSLEKKNPDCIRWQLVHVSGFVREKSFGTPSATLCKLPSWAGSTSLRSHLRFLRDSGFKAWKEQEPWKETETSGRSRSFCYGRLERGSNCSIRSCREGRAQGVGESTLRKVNRAVCSAAEQSDCHTAQGPAERFPSCIRNYKDYCVPKG